MRKLDLNALNLYIANIKVAEGNTLKICKEITEVYQLENETLDEFAQILWNEIKNRFSNLKEVHVYPYGNPEYAEDIIEYYNDEDEGEDLYIYDSKLWENEN